MAIRTYISIITLNVNGLNAPTKRQTGWMDAKTRPAVYKKPTSDVKTHIDWKWADGKIKSFSDKQKLIEFSTTKPAL